MDHHLRIEKRPSASGDKYYLVKDIRVGKRGTKVSRLIKTGSPPTPEEQTDFLRIVTIKGFKIEI